MLSAIIYIHYYIIIQGGFLLFVQVEDDDTAIDDHVDDIFIDMPLATNSPTIPAVFVGNFNNGRLELSFSVTCSSGFTGADCTTRSMLISSNFYTHRQLSLDVVK